MYQTTLLFRPNCLKHNLHNLVSMPTLQNKGDYYLADRGSDQRDQRGVEEEGTDVFKQRDERENNYYFM